MKKVFACFILYLNALITSALITTPLYSSCLLGSEYDTFPEWDTPLPFLEERGSFLAANDGEMAKLLKMVIDQRTKLDPEICFLTRLDATKTEFQKMVGHHPPYDFNRLIPKDNPEIYLNASVVHTPEQEFILAGCPVLPEQAAELFMYFLEGSASNRVWVSLLDSSEKQNFTNNFWLPNVVKTLPLRKGWKVKKTLTKVLQKGINSSIKGTETSLVKTTLVFSNGIEQKTINHLHYTGWFDRCRCPDGGLFLRLLDEMSCLNEQPKGTFPSKEIPIGINCIGGVGRTGMLAAGYIAYLKMRNSFSNGQTSMTINIPEIIYSLRKQRAKTAENSVHLISLYSFLGIYYKQLENQSSGGYECY